MQYIIFIHVCELVGLLHQNQAFAFILWNNAGCIKVRHVPHVSNLLDAGVTFATIIASSLKQLFTGQALWGFSTVLADTCE